MSPIEIVLTVGYFLIAIFVVGYLSAEVPGVETDALLGGTFWPVTIAFAALGYAMYGVYCAGKWCGRKL